MSVVNERRADRGFRAVLAYGIIGGDEEEAIIGLLTDLRHMSDQYGWTLDDLVERSAELYETEVLTARYETEVHEAGGSLTT